MFDTILHFLLLKRSLFLYNRYNENRDTISFTSDLQHKRTI